jgi:hypothetical protein
MDKYLKWKMLQENSYRTEARDKEHTSGISLKERMAKHLTIDQSLEY